MTPPTSDEGLFLRETWQNVRGRRTELKIWTPQRDPEFPRETFVVWRQIVNLDDVPRPHVQISPALAIHDAIHFALWGHLTPQHVPVRADDTPLAKGSPARPPILDEPWEARGSTGYRLRVWSSELEWTSPNDTYVAWFQVVGLDPAPRPHHQISGALAIWNAIDIAVRDLLLAGAHPVV